MIVIRKGVFETNSSSSHSISISSLDVDTSVPVFTPNENGEVVIYTGEFGWGPQMLYTPEEKASYALTECMGRPAKQAILREVIADLAQIEPEKVVFDTTSTWAHIDHQSQGTLHIADDPETRYELTCLLAGPNSVIDIDNDNH